MEYLATLTTDELTALIMDIMYESDNRPIIEIAAAASDDNAIEAALMWLYNISPDDKGGTARLTRSIVLRWLRDGMTDGSVDLLCEALETRQDETGHITMHHALLFDYLNELGRRAL